MTDRASAVAAAVPFIVSESLVVLHGVGVLLLSERGAWWWRGTHKLQFLDLADIHSVIIHEVSGGLGLGRGVVNASQGSWGGTCSHITRSSC
jgi:hypothetical protein